MGPSCYFFYDRGMLSFSWRAHFSVLFLPVNCVFFFFFCLFTLYDRVVEKLDLCTGMYLVRFIVPVKEIFGPYCTAQARK